LLETKVLDKENKENYNQIIELLEMEVYMPELTIAVQVSDVAKAIKVMKKEELETLALLLTENGAELLERKKDFERNKDAFLSKEDVFGV
jgi:hypothetical protein